ncbi:MAG: ABC transporter ATP-binding protein [Firmicutes bacterium]|nr:ABC transporter ATP-binding protein [Bacillota bacterium]
MHTLEIRDLTKQIKDKMVLDHVSLEITNGQIIGMIGDNGSGKTMLMRAICGLIIPTSGDILFDGKKRTIANPSIGAMIENTSLFPDMTGIENLKLLAKIRQTATVSDINQAITRVGLDPKDKRTFRKYSLGMKQRLLLAQAIMEKPDILLLDEPTNAIDQEGVQRVHEIMQEEAERGAIVLLASHISIDIHSLCAKVYQMDHGRLSEVQV